MSDLNALVDEARHAFAQARTSAELEDAKAVFLGKSGRITALMKGLAGLSVDEKKAQGAAINGVKREVEALLNGARQALAEAALARQLEAEALDVTLPGRRRSSGGLHPVSLTLERIEGILAPWASTWQTALRSRPIGSTSPP